LKHINNEIQPKVSIVSVNFNQPEVTCDMIASIKCALYKNIEIIIVDNGSSTSIKPIIERYPEIKIISSNKNLGFAGGNNIGFKAATGKYILMLNNDTEVKKDFLSPLVDLLENEIKVGIVSSKILYYDNHLIQYAGATPLHPITSRNRYFGNKEIDNGKFNNRIETAYPHGACMMFRISLLKEIGVFYEGYFLYYEELDFAERVKKLGYKIMMEPKSVILHKESVSTGKESPLKTYYLNRNRLLYLRRNLKGISFLLASLYFILVSVPKNTITFLFRPSHLKAIYKGLYWNLTHANVHANSHLNNLRSNGFIKV